MEKKPIQLEDLKKAVGVFDLLTKESLRRGLFEKTEHVVTVHNALLIFNAYLNEQSTGKGTEHSVDNRASNPIAPRNRRNISQKKTAEQKTEKPTTQGSAGDGPTATNGGELKQLSIPGTVANVPESFPE